MPRQILNNDSIPGCGGTLGVILERVGGDLTTEMKKGTGVDFEEHSNDVDLAAYYIKKPSA